MGKIMMVALVIVSLTGIVFAESAGVEDDVALTTFAAERSQSIKSPTARASEDMVRVR